MRRPYCSFHCVQARAEFAQAAIYRRLAFRFHRAGVFEMRDHYKKLARGCHDTGRAFREQIPHLFLGGISYGYQPADPKLPNRRVVVRLG